MSVCVAVCCCVLLCVAVWLLLRVAACVGVCRMRILLPTSQNFRSPSGLAVGHLQMLRRGRARIHTPGIVLLGGLLPTLSAWHC